MQGGGQSDTWHTLHCKGKYAGEIRIELTYYDTRPKGEKAAMKEESSILCNQKQPYSRSEQRSVDATKRRPLPTGPSNPKKPVPRSTKQALLRNRAIENERFHLMHTNSEPIMEDPNLKYHHNWNHDMSQGSSHSNIRGYEPSRSQQFEREPLSAEEQFSTNELPSQERAIYDNRLETHVPDNPHTSSGYTGYHPQNFDEQPAGFSTMRRRTEPIPTLYADAGQRNRAIARPEHEVILEGDISGIEKRQALHTYQDEFETATFPAPRTRGTTVLSNGIGSLPSHSITNTSGFILPDEVNRGQNIHEHENEQYLREGPQREYENKLSNFTHDRLHRPNSYNQSQANYPYLIDNSGPDEHDEVPPPPPLHRTALNDSDKSSLRQPEDTLVAPVPLRFSRQEAVNRHSYPNHIPMSYENAMHNLSQDDMTCPTIQENQPRNAYSGLESGPNISDVDNQVQHGQVYQVGITQKSSAKRFSDEENLHSRSEDREPQRASIRTRPLSLSIGGYQFEEDMQHSRSNQPSQSHVGNIEPRKSIAQTDLVDHSQRSYADRASHGIQLGNGRETFYSTNPRTVSPDDRHTRNSNRSTPTRKSVSPQPARPNASIGGMSSSGVPFSPDSYESISQTQPGHVPSPLAQGSSQLHVKSKGTIDITPAATAAMVTTTSRLSASDDTLDGPIIGPDGRVIDPSDHLPVDSWAPEPERKNPHKPAPIRIRVSPRGAQPMPSNAKRENATRITAYSASPLVASTSNESHAPNGRQANVTSGSGGRARLQKRLPAGWGSVGQHDGFVRAGDGQGLGSGPASAYGEPGGSVPPVPAKIPMNVGAVAGGGSVGNPDDLLALSEEMKSIDIGTGAGRSVGRSSRGRYG